MILSFMSEATNRVAARGVGYFLGKAQHYLRSAHVTALQQVNLTASQYEVLSELSAAAGLSGAALAKRCFVTPQTMTGVIRKLEAAGLVVRTPDPDHGRIIRTHLTPPGADLMARAQRLVDGVEERMLADLDRAEREALSDLLAQCADALKSTRGTRRQIPLRSK
jgi:DNA-binding MarR family transcriptional regulator